MSRLGSFAAVVSMLFVAGCGGSSSKSVDVAGVISLNGEPLADVEVYFANGKFEGYGKTDEDGKYRLVNGAAVGNNKVYLRKFNTEGASGIDTSIPGMDAGQVAAMMAAQSKSQPGKSASMIPPEYSDPATTKLTFPVPEEGTSTADFRISSK